MTHQIIKRLLYALATFAGAGALVSVLLSVVPDQQLNQTSTERMKANLRTFLTFDYGLTKNEAQPIKTIVWDRSKKSFVLIAGAVLLNLLIGVPLAVYSALRPHNGYLNAILGFCQLISSVPMLVWAVIVSAACALVGQFSPSYALFADFNTPLYFKAFILMLLIAVLTFGDGILWQTISSIREETSRVLQEEYIRAVRARNVGVLRHIQRSLIVPVTSVIFSKIPYFVGGTIIVEYVFDWKGLAYQVWKGISTHGYRDYAFLLAATMVFVAVVVTLNLISSILAVVVDPRLRDLAK